MDARLLRAAKEGNIYAMLAVAYSFQKGREAPVDPQSAIEWYTRSANRGCSRAKWELAKMYHFGNLVPPDKAKYLEWLRAAADGGTPEARRELSFRYMHGSLVPHDESAAFEWLRAAASQKDPLSMFRLAYCYRYGICCKANIKESDYLFHEVTVQGDAELFFKIGMNYEFGLESVTPDLNEASKWYTRGAKMGHDRCYFCLTRVKAILKGDAPDTYEARITMLKRTMSALEENERERLLEEADEFMDQGMVDEALDGYQKAADLGNPEAMFMLAILYHEGELVRRNDPLAFDFLTRASLSGSTEAQLLLGKSYETGRGRNHNDEEATKYYAMAAAAGNLVGYYELSRFMDHPEIFVRSTQKVVR